MPEEKRTYKIGDKTYNVPVSEVDGFLKRKPEAVLINKYEFDGKTYAVPETDLDGFLQRKPGAKLVSGSKKKVEPPVSETKEDVSALGSIQESSPLPSSTIESILRGEPEKDPILKRASEKSPWLAAPINLLTGLVHGNSYTIMKPLDGAQKIFYRGVGEIMSGSMNPAIKAAGAKLLVDQDKQKTWWKRAEEAMEKYAEEKLPPKIGAPGSPYKKDIVSDLLYTAGELAPFIGTVALTPNPSIFGVGMKLPLNMATIGGLEEYSTSDDLGQAIKAGAIGAGDGMAFTLLGFGSGIAAQKIGQQLLKASTPWAAEFGATASKGGMMFGGGMAHDVAKQISEGVKPNEIDWERARHSGLTFLMLEAPGIVNSAVSVYKRAPRDVMALSRQMDAAANELRNRAVEYEVEASKAKTTEAKVENLLAASNMHKMADIKAMDEFIGKSPKEAREMVEKSELNDKQKREMLERIDDSVIYYEQKKVEQKKAEELKKAEEKREEARGSIELKIEEEGGKFVVRQEGTPEGTEFKTREEAESFKEKFEIITGGDRGMEFKEKKRLDAEDVAAGKKKKIEPEVTKVEKDAIQERKTEKVPVAETPEAGKEVDGKVREQAAAKEIIAEHEKSGGATFDTAGKNLAGSDMSSVGIFPERTRVVKGELKPEDITKFKEENKDLLDGNEGVLAIGTWKKAEGEHVLDITALTSKDQAMELGKKYNQEAIYDLKTGELIETGGTGAPIEGVRPEVDRIADVRGRTGQQNEAFFTEKAETASSDVPYEPVIKIDKETPVAKAYDTYSAGGNFTGHISKMIPGFQEKQIRVGEAIVASGKKSFLDIGASEGGLVKTVASQDPSIRAVAVDPNSQMKKNFESTPEVKNAEFRQEAFQGSWTEADGTKIKEFKPEKKFDIINEDFTFQFVNNNRKKQVEGVKEMLAEDGIFITSEKFITENKEANEAKKAKHQEKYFTREERTADKEGIVTGMEKDMVKDTEYFETLKDNFKYVEEFWNAGEFKGFVASDSKASIESFRKNVGDLTTEFTDKASRTATGGPPVKPPKPPKPPKDEIPELPDPEGKPERPVMEVIREREAAREKEAKIIKDRGRMAWEYVLYDQLEPFKKRVLKAGKEAGARKEARRVVDRKNVEKGSKAQTAVEFSEILKDVGGHLFGKMTPKQMRLISEYNDIRRTNELYKSRKAFGKKELLEEGGLTHRQAEEFLTKVKNKDPEIVKDYGDYNPKEIIEASDKFNQTYRDMLTEMKNEGLITKEAYDQIVFEHPYYSPRKYMDVIDKIDIQGSLSGVEALKGGSEGAKFVDAPSLLFEAISRKNNLIARARTFRAMEKFIDKASPDFMRKARYTPEFVEKLKKKEEGDPWIEPQFEPTPRNMEAVDYIDANGMRKRFFIDADVHKYFEQQPFSDFSRKVLNASGWLSGTKLLKASATGYNPEFLVKNIPIDMMHILMTTDAYTGVLAVDFPMIMADMGAVAKDAANRTGTYKDYIKEGGGMRMLTGEGKLREGRSEHKLKKTRQAVEALEDLASYPGETSELLTRLALRRRQLINLKREFKKENGREPDAKELQELQMDATAFARNYLDFEQGGRLVKVADSVIPYLNAGFQVTRGSLRAAGNKPALFSAKVMQLAGTAAAITAWNMGLISTKNIDEDMAEGMKHAYLNDISDEVKAKNFVVMTPKKYTDAAGNERYLYWKIPKDNMQELITGIAEDGIHKKVLGEDFGGYLTPRRLKELQASVQSFTNVANTPPMVRGALGYTLNKDMYYKAPIWPSADGAGDYGRDKGLEFLADTPERYKALGKIPLPGGHRLSPMRSQYVAKQFFTESNVIATGIGELMDRGIGGVNQELKTEYTPDEVEQLKNDPFRRRFIKATYPGASNRDYGTNTQEYNKLKKVHDDGLNELIMKEAPMEDVMKYLDGILEEDNFSVTAGQEYKRLLRRYEKKVLKPSAAKWIQGLQYEPAIPRAEDLFEQWMIMNDEMRNWLIEEAQVAGVLSETTANRFFELMDQYEQEVEERLPDESEPGEAKNNSTKK